MKSVRVYLIRVLIGGPATRMEQNETVSHFTYSTEIQIAEYQSVFKQQQQQ